MSQQDGESIELKREVSSWGSFSMGYADVGADIYVALGVIAVWAAGASPLAFAIAAITYITTGLCYAELSTAYPVAGGGQYYSMKAFGRIHGFIAGWGLMLDYTIDIALFALVTVGYLGAVLEIVAHNGVLFTSPAFSLAAVALIVLLIGLNLLGIRNSSRLNETIVAFDLVTVSLFIVVGIPYIIYSGALQTWFQALIQDLATGSFGVPSLGWFSFVNAVTLAMVSFIGIESISQAAEETKKPERVIPSATKRAITSVTVVALALSLLSVSAVPWQTTAASTQDPTIPIAKALPVIGPYFYIWVALMGTLICYVSTNTGVIGVSRVTFSMGRLGLLPRGLARVSSRFRTPYVTIALFSGVAIALLLATSLLSGTDILLLVASLYNFGALVAYMYVNAAAIALRFKEPGRRSWKMPLNFDVPWKGVTYSVSAIPIVGFVSTLTVWILIVGTHPGGRELGIAWFAVGIVGYLIYQRKLKKEREA